MAVFQLGAVAPRVAASAWVAESAQVIGDVELGQDVGVWFGAVLRGDNEPIRIGKGSNVQECCVFHTDPGFPLTLGEDVTVGHQATLHGCTVGDGTLIGVRAVVLNGATIGRCCLVAAGAVVVGGKEFAEGSLIVGSPAKAVRTLTPEEVEKQLRGAERYRENARRFRAELKRLA